MQSATESIKKDKACLIVTASDVSEKTKKEISFFAHNKNIPVFILNDVTIEKLSMSVGRKCGVIAVIDDGFADVISKILGGCAHDQ